MLDTNFEKRRMHISKQNARKKERKAVKNGKTD